MNIKVELLSHQAKFALDTHRYVALIGGFGCGKSYGIAVKTYYLSRINAGFDGMLISRTGKQLDRLMIEVHKAFGTLGLYYDDSDITRFRRNAIPNSYTEFGNRQLVIFWGQKLFSTLYLETADSKAFTAWSGGNMAYVVIDELDTIPRAEEVWSFANDRVRMKAPLLQTACASTPEGYGFLWDFFENKPAQDPKHRDDRIIYRGCTFDSPYIDVKYVSSQIKTRDPASLRAYVYGEFVNLDGTLVYYKFDKNANATTRTLSEFPLNAICRVGVDFNKNINAANVSIVENGNIFTVKEFYGAKNIDVLIADLRAALRGRPISIYPDASCFEGIQQLERAFGENAVHYAPSNPRVERRVTAVNNKLCNQAGVPTIFINQRECPHLTNSLLRQTKDAAGAPDKTQGLDHAGDGFGYFIYFCFPPVEQTATINVISGNSTKYNTHHR